MKTKLVTLGYAVLSVLVLWSCISIDDTLDLDKDLSLDMKLGDGGLFIPIGTLDTIWLDSLLNVGDDADSPVKLLDDGIIGLCVSGDIDDVVYEIDPVEVSIGELYVPVIVPSFNTPLVGLPVPAFQAIVRDSSEINIDVPVDDCVSSISEACLVQPADMSFSLQFSNLPQSVTGVRVDGFQTVFPDFLNMSYSGQDSRVTFDPISHTLTVQGDILPEELSASGNGFVVNGLSVTGLDFKTNPIRKDSDTRLVIDKEMIMISGYMTVSGESLLSTDIQETELNFEMAVGDFSIASITGVANPEIEPVSESVALSLGDDLDFLYDPENCLSINDIRIALNMNTTSGIEFNVSLSASSKDRDGVVIPNCAVTPDNGDFTIPACSPAEDSRSFTILLYSADLPSVTGDDTIPVQVSNLPLLVARMPDSISFNLNTYVDGNEETTFAFNDISISGDYDITIPLSFDAMTIVYTDTIDGLAEDLKDVTDYVSQSSARLEAKYVSSVPFSIELSVMAIDSLGKELEEIGIDPVVIPAGNENEVKTDTVGFDLSITDGGIEKLDGFIFSAKCVADDGTPGEKSLKTSGFILVKDIFMAFEDGLEIDLSETDDDDGKK